MDSEQHSSESLSYDISVHKKEILISQDICEEKFKNKLLATTWIDLEDIALSEIIQIQTDRHCVSHLHEKHEAVKLMKAESRRQESAPGERRRRGADGQGYQASAVQDESSGALFFSIVLTADNTVICT